MSADRALKYLWDASQAAERIARFTVDRDFDGYMADELSRAAVERQFEIVGEALGRLAREAPEIAAQIPDLGRIIAFRNMLIHGYASVDHVRVWGVIVGQLPQLRAVLSRLSDADL